MEVAKTIWNSRFVACILWLSALCASVWFWFNPSTGAAIAVLGAVAAIMSIREIGPREKFLWLLVVFGLLSVELHSIKKDDDARKDAATKEEDNFKTIGQGLSKSITDNQRAFEATVSRIERLDKLSRYNIEEVTGGKGFVTLEPVIYLVDNDGLTLDAWVHGKHPIRDVSYSLKEGPSRRMSSQEFNDFLAGRSNMTQIGDLSANAAQVIGRVLHPSKTEVTHYDILIYAINGMVAEQLDVRYSVAHQGWNFKIAVNRNDAIIFQHDWIWPVN